MAFPTTAAASVPGYVRMLSAWAILLSTYESFEWRWSAARPEERCPSFEEVVEHLFGLRERARGGE